MARSKPKAAVDLATVPARSTGVGSEPLTAVIGSTGARQGPENIEKREVGATSRSIPDLSSQLQPEVGRIVDGVPLALDAVQQGQLVNFPTSEQAQIVRQLELGGAWDAAVERSLPTTVCKPAIVGELGSVVVPVRRSA